ncbi:MAG: phenylalanine--tRNA ligase subunit alpha [Candidatus Verstraetearchaeota archaeon]|nr:phenylalanine--tRNA ligase subunit alpha [Candidatus Verstraetearchaeota archaeon]
MPLSQSEALLLKYLEKLGGKAEASSLASGLKQPVSSIFPLSSLLAEKGYVKTTEILKEKFELTEEGAYCAKHGMPETRLLRLLSSKGGTAPMDALKTALKPTEISAALGWGRKAGAIAIEKRGTPPLIVLKRTVNIELDDTIKKLSKDGEKSALTPKELELVSVLEERGLVTLKETKQLIVEMIRGIRPSGGVVSNVLTSDIIKSGRWRKTTLSPYDVTASPPSLKIGKKHPYLEFLEEVKEILIAMGFEEASGPYAESEFWNFDALFQAQDHPARAIHDSFQIKGVEPHIDAPEEVIKGVKAAHEYGGRTGSKGWGYRWNIEIAKRPILRTQTTAVSVRHLSTHKTPPVKAFCLSKNFRPDVIDSRHMVEFCQLDGIIGDRNMNVRHLLWTLKEFAMQLGFKDIKFTPGYFPFTEPSIEAYAKHHKLGWIECLGSGLFRPEVLEPLGVKFPVLAWAFGIDRLAMIRLGIDDIRELHTSNLESLREKGWR